MLIFNFLFVLWENALREFLLRLVTVCVVASYIILRETFGVMARNGANWKRLGSRLPFAFLAGCIKGCLVSHWFGDLLSFSFLMILRLDPHDYTPGKRSHPVWFLF